MNLRPIRRVSMAVVAIGLAVMACGGASDPFASSPAATVRRAFDRIEAHDLLGGSELVCPAQRDPSRPPMTVGGLLSPLASVPAGSFAETLALIDIDATDVRVEEVNAREGVVLVPVSGILRLRLDPAEAEAAVRAAAAAQNEAVDEAELGRTLDAIAAGPFELDVGREMKAVQVHEDRGRLVDLRAAPERSAGGAGELSIELAGRAAHAGATDARPRSVGRAGRPHRRQPCGIRSPSEHSTRIWCSSGPRLADAEPAGPARPTTFA